MSKFYNKSTVVIAEIVILMRFDNFSYNYVDIFIKLISLFQMCCVRNEIQLPFLFLLGNYKSFHIRNF